MMALPSPYKVGCAVGVFIAATIAFILHAYHVDIPAGYETLSGGTFSILFGYLFEFLPKPPPQPPEQ
jgi:hypothetical protein